jgi:hypothetical protein
MITKDIAESHTIKTALVFGEIAVKKGFLTQEQLDEALTAQRSFMAISSEKALKRIGDILFEKGWLTVAQIYNVQSEVFNQLA